MGPPWRGAPIHPFILGGVGAAVGWLAGTFMRSSGTVLRIEEVLVGVFGAFAGGDFLLAQWQTPVAAPAPLFSPPAFGLAVAGAAVLLVLLRVLRGAVGPLRAGKRRTRRN